MPIKCTLRENRTVRRFWTAKKAGQAACQAMFHGATLQEIEAEIAKCGRGRPSRGNREALEALQVAEVALFDSNDLLNADSAFLERFNALPLTTGLIFRLLTRIPLLGTAASVAVTLMRTQATAKIGQIAKRVAANDDAIRIVSRAAANESRFLRTGTGL